VNPIWLPRERRDKVQALMMVPVPESNDDGMMEIEIRSAWRCERTVDVHTRDTSCVDRRFVVVISTSVSHGRSFGLSLSHNARSSRRLSHGMVDLSTPLKFVPQSHYTPSYHPPCQSHQTPNAKPGFQPHLPLEQVPQYLASRIRMQRGKGQASTPLP
jgi:hypothetical protein